MKIIAWAIVFFALCLADTTRLIVWRLMTHDASATAYPVSWWIGGLAFAALGAVVVFSFNK